MHLEQLLGLLKCYYRHKGYSNDYPQKLKAMFKLLVLNSLGLGANTPHQSRNIDKENLLVYDLTGSPRKFVRSFLQNEFGNGDVWVIHEHGDFAVVELTFSGYRITGTHNNTGEFNCKQIEGLIKGLNEYCQMES